MFGLDIQGIVAQAFAGQLQTGTLTKVTPGAYDPNDGANGNSPTTVDYPGDCVVTAYKPGSINGTSIRRDDFQVMFILGSLSGSVVPAEGDRVTTTPPNGTAPRTGIVVKIVAIDPAAATATVQVR